MASGKFYLTTAIDYANGDPHIGHPLPTQALKAALLSQGYFLWPAEDAAAPAEPRAFQD